MTSLGAATAKSGLAATDSVISGNLPPANNRRGSTIRAAAERPLVDNRLAGGGRGRLRRDDESDFSLEELDELLDFSEELDVSLELDPSELDDELDLAEPLLELFVDSRLSLR